MNIITDRLQIRFFSASDWKEVHEYTSNQSVMTYIPEGVMSEQATKDFIRKNQGEHAKNFAVVLTETNTIIGHIVFHKYFGEHTYEIGWVFNPKYYNKGYATEAATATLKYGFETLGLHRVIATCQPENKSSYRVMEKIGMRREGFFKKCIPHGDTWWDEYYYAILEEEWMAANNS
ncbi:N-acetyltransferase [Bacillus sp. HMF5848]|uniref:GNAT family N-acetyltransferase n=1 Tax=Bacillus sp. HMF5848 TaxID=2495421 RepID=UPI000F78E889|nr:GNAT family N-acetyltransferase [Bacillus sp. HMF5848]RSK27552.1 N-acetyltransferase [Bacillus sp. HMF5848]